MQRRKVIFVLALLVAAIGVAELVGRSPPPSSPAAPPAAPERSVILGVTQHPAPWDMSALDDFERMAGKQVGIVSYFIGYEPDNPPERDVLERIQTRGAVPLITWEWHQLDGLRSIVQSQYDDDIKLWAEELKAFGGPVLLRWGHEMNLPNFPWSVGVAGNTEADYVSAWRHIREIFRNTGANNVEFVWSPNISGGNARDFKYMFPGDSYVDWLALDGYNWATLNQWKSFSEVFSDSYGTITKLSSKPLMIAEWGSTEQGGDKSLWIRQALSEEIPGKFPRINAIVYFNQNYEEDWRIESSPQAEEAFRQGISSSIYKSFWR